MFRILLCCCTAALLSSAIGAQAVTLFEGPTRDQLTVRVLDATRQPVDRVLPGLRKLRPIALVGTTGNQHYEVDRPRVVERAGHRCIELPSGDRLFSWERLDQTGHGILLVERGGSARDVYSGQAQIDAPLSVATDRRHVAFADDQEVVLVRLGEPFPGGESSRRARTPTQIVPRSVVVGTSHVFFVTDDDRVWRQSLAMTQPPEDITPPLPYLEQDDGLAISGDGRTIAFLRGDGSGSFAVWVAGGSGPARRLSIAERDYRRLGDQPPQGGNPPLLLAHDGSRLMVTEAGVEDEIHCTDTGSATPAVHVTANHVFAEYIGIHILPRFRGRDLLLASGHQGWADWYLARADGTVINVTQTGSPEPPFFVGSLGVVARQPLANGDDLSIERLGADWTLRRMSPGAAAQAVVAVASGPPAVGCSLRGGPDLLVESAAGQLWLSGTNGASRAVVPPGLQLTPPLRGVDGWSVAYLHIAGSFGVPVVLLDDGAVVPGDLMPGLPELAVTATGELLVLHPDRLQVFGRSGSLSLPLAPVAVRFAVSGAVR